MTFGIFHNFDLAKSFCAASTFVGVVILVLPDVAHAAR